jgi:hypothetical protein
MSEYVFDHDRLDVYRLSIDYTSDAFKIGQLLDGLHRHARDQWLRAAHMSHSQSKHAYGTMIGRIA